MASVRLTNDIRQTIHRRAMEAFNLARPEPKPSTWLTDRLRDAILSSEPYKIMKNFHDTQTLYSFSSLGGYSKNVSRSEDARVTLVTKTEFGTNTTGRTLNLSFEMVPQLVTYRQSSWGTPEFYFEELSLEAQHQLGPQCVELTNAIRENTSERNTYSTKISQLLDNCTTVKQMLLAWPAGESFVPDENKRRMYEKVTRIERAERIKKDVQFDDSFVNEVVLTAKLVGG
jgi:hypothetical protein